MKISQRKNNLRVEFYRNELLINEVEYSKMLAVKAYEPLKEINRGEKVFYYFDNDLLLDIETIQQTNINNQVLY